MSEPDALAEPFERSRAHLRAVALRMLGSAAEADDAVQEAWLRLNRTDTSSVENLGGWLTTVVSRVCLDMLRSRKSRREDLVGVQVADELPANDDDAEHEAHVADAVGPALLVVLETLGPAERIAFVLHDMFAIPFEEIASILGRTPAAARQLASRGRRRVQGGWPLDADGADAEEEGRQREIVDAFVAASRNGRFEDLLAILDPDVVLRADDAASKLGAAARIGDLRVRGAEAVAKHFAGRARAAQAAMVDGLPSVVWAPNGTVKVAFSIAIEQGRIVAIDLIAEPADLARYAIEILGPPGE